MVRQIRPRELAQKLANGHLVQLLDVRQPEEHQYVALPDDFHVPLGQLAQLVDSLGLRKEEAVVVYCHYGIRSLHGAKIMEMAGFTNVWSLAGGIDAWAREVDPGMARY